MISRTTCPTCGTRVSPESSPAMPFCSRRCRQIDLGLWLDGQIGIPLEPEDIPPDELLTDRHQTDRHRDDDDSQSWFSRDRGNIDGGQSR